MADGQESLVQTVARNLTPKTDTSRSALPKDERLTADQSPQQEGEQQYSENFGSPLQVAYGKMKNFLAEHEQHLSDEVLKPFREGLDRMGDDLVDKGLNTHSPILAATGEMMKAVPVGSDVKSTAAALVVPPELEEESGIGKALAKNGVKDEVRAVPTIEHVAASESEPAKAVLKDGNGKMVGQAKWTMQGDEAHLNGIYVDPELKGKGHGSMLRNAVVDKAQAAGAKGLTVGKVNSATPDAISLFDRHTAHPVETVQSPIKGSQARRINLAEQAKTDVKLSTDTNGIRWAESPEGYKVSIPKSVSDQEASTYAAPKLKEQSELHSKMKSEATKKGSESL